MKKHLFIYILFTALCFTSCGLQKQKEKSPSVSPTTLSAEAVAVETEEPTATPAPTAPSKTAKKTVKEAFGAWLNEEYIMAMREGCFSEEYADVRYDDVSEWKDKQGNYQFPKGYVHTFAPNGTDPYAFAPQQMPQALLEEISTEELYQLILNVPTDDDMGWHNTYERYLQMLSAYYSVYNFIENFMEREDAAQVVHQQYQKYTKKEIKRYSKRYRGYEDYSVEEWVDEGKFQLTEGLEWFFLYQEGKKVPDYQVLGYDLMETW